jgi:uncharacterized membrane protein YgcG
MDSRESPSSSDPRRAGIALMVVMVVFIILYLVAYHLTYSTTMEEKMSHLRGGEVVLQDSMYSVALYAMTLLLEDLKQDQSQLAGGAGAASSGGLGGLGLEGLLPGGGGGPSPAGGGPNPADGSGGNFVPLDGAAGGGAASALRHFDYLRETIFNDNEQTVGDVSVKIKVRDNERALDLNRIFDYARLILRGTEPGLAGLNEEDLASAVLDAPDDATAEQNLRQRLSARGAQLRSRSGGSSAAGGARSSGAGGAAGGPGADGDEAGDDAAPGAGAGAGASAAGGEAAAVEDDLGLAEFEQPDGEVLELTHQILERAIDMMFSLNELNGFFYQSKYNPGTVADEIIRYVIQVRSSPVQNVIYHSSELLNIEYITPEVYYGPQPVVPPGGEVTTDDGFVIRRDEFGDLIYEYQYDSEYLAEQEARQEDLNQLIQDAGPLGQFMDFPGFGGLMGSRMTRNMTELPLVADDQGNEFILEPRRPIGLKDIFTAFSSGKVNLNTAPVPVLYGLLVSLEEGANGEANDVALQIDDYRNRMQDYAEEEAGQEAGQGVARVADPNAKPDLGQPRRRLPTPEEEEAEAAELSDLGATGLAGASSAYEDRETNYFTDLKQIELVDGTDGGRGDKLTSTVGIDRVSGDQDSLLQRVLNDYTPLMVFGSTYFTVELRAKSSQSNFVKTGVLVLRRDPAAKVLDVVLWKELTR